MVEAFPSLLQKPAGELAHTHAALVEVLGRSGMAKAVAASPFVLGVRSSRLPVVFQPLGLSLVGELRTRWPKGKVVPAFARF